MIFKVIQGRVVW